MQKIKKIINYLNFILLFFCSIKKKFVKIQTINEKATHNCHKRSSSH